MTTQFDAILQKFTELESQVIDVEHLTKTLKNSFDISNMETENCYYLESIIRILRKKTNSLKQKTTSLNEKLNRLNDKNFNSIND